MIEMFIDNTALVLPTDLKIRVELNSPAFETDVIPTSIVYYFDVPAELNEVSFNYANYTEVKNKFREYNWKMRYQGFWIFSGKLIVTKITNVFRCAASIKQLPTDMGDRNITDFKYDKIMLGRKSMQDFITEIRNENKNEISFPEIYVPNLYGDDKQSNPSWQGIVNRKNIENTTTTNPHSVIPIFHATHILNLIFSTEEYSLNLPDDPKIKSLMFFNNYTLDKSPIEYYAFSNLKDQKGLNFIPTDDPNNCIRNNKYYIPLAGEYEITVFAKAKLLDTSSSSYATFIYVLFQYQDPEDSSKIIEDRIVFEPIGHDYENPILRFTMIDTTFTKRIAPGTGWISFNGYFKKNGLGSGLQVREYEIENGHIEVKRIKNSGTTEGGTDQNTYSNEINIPNHLPEVSLSDFLLSLKQLFGATYFFDFTSKQIQVVILKDLLEARTLDLTEQHIAIPPEIDINEPISYELKYDLEEFENTGYDYAGAFPCLIIVETLLPPVKEKTLIKILNTNSYYESKIIDNELKYVRIADSFKHLKTNNYTKKEIIDIKIKPMSMFEYKYAIYPYYDDKGISSMFLPGTSKVDKIMYFCKIDKLDSTCSNLNYCGQKHNLFSFDMEREDGVYNQYLKPWYDFISTANTYTMEFRVNIEDIFRIIELFTPQPVTPPEQIRKIRVLNQNFIPVQFTHNSITCQAKLMKNDD